MGRVRTSAGLSIGFDETGTSGTEPIIFLHGVGSDKSVWHPQLEHFGRERRAIAFDYPGYGDSDAAPQNITRDDYALAILSAMTELRVEQAHICGLSLGGVVAIALNHAAAQRCLSLILADSFAKHPDGKGIYDRSIAASKNMRALAEGRVDALLAQPADPAVRSEVVETMSRIDPAAFRIGAQAVWLADQTDRAAAIRAPTLVLCGSEDSVTAPALSKQLAALIPGARYETIERAGHITNLEAAEAFNGVLDEFLQTLN